MRRFFCLLLAAFAPGYVYAQVGLSPAEQASLTRALGEAGNSPVDFMRAVENHLKQYPNSPQRAELERAILKTAIDQNDDPRVIRFGESVLARDPDNVQVLEHVATALLRQGDQAFAERALERARHLEQVIHSSRQLSANFVGSG